MSDDEYERRTNIFLRENRDSLGTTQVPTEEDPELLAEAIDFYIDPRTEIVLVHYSEERFVIVTHRALRTATLRPEQHVSEISPHDHESLIRVRQLLGHHHPLFGFQKLGEHQRRLPPPIPTGLARLNFDNLDPIGIFYSEKFAVVVTEKATRPTYLVPARYLDHAPRLIAANQDDLAYSAGYNILLVDKETWLSETILWTKHPEDTHSTKWDLRTLFCLPLL